ncbi:MAG: hypothetical protein P1V20_04080 [Verrucomicrobiales bacterium]|nr:hypothetical protein [Verrucomicrobiales bacterium]
MNRLIVFLTLSFHFYSLCPAQEVRVFTNKEGVEISAKYLGVLNDGKFVKILRVSDGRQFVFPVTTLSLEDQAYIAEQIKKQAAESSGAGRTLLIKGINVRDRAAPFTTRTIWEDPNIGATEHRLAVPRGAWICYSTTIEDTYGRYFIPYKGERLFEFEASGNELWLKRDGAEKELVGVVITYESGFDDKDIRRKIRSIDGTKVKHVLGIAFQSSSYLEQIDALSEDIPIAVYTPGTLSRKQWAALAKAKVIGIHADIDSSDLPELATQLQLEQLAVNIKNHPDGQAIDLPPLPKLKHLVMLNGGRQINWDKSLQGLPALESLVLLRSSQETPSGGTPVSSFAANPKLRLLALNDSSGIAMQASALTTSPNLRFLHYIDRAVEGDLTVEMLKNLPNLEYFSGIDATLSGNQIDEWLATGAGKIIRDFASYSVPDCKLLPKLERLRVEKSSMQGGIYEYERLSHAPASLLILDIEGISNKDFELLQLPEPGALVSLRLFATKIDNVDLLYRFNKVRKLYYSSNSGRISSINLAKFPDLEYLSLYSFTDLEKLENLTASKSLRYLSLSRNDYLTDLGEAVANDTLEEINLNYLARLTSLSSFERLSNIKRVYLYKLAKLENYANLDTAGTLKYMSIRECGGFEDRTIDN